MKKFSPPSYLSKAAKALWAELVEEYGIVDSGGVRTLEAGIPQFDRAEQLRREIKKQGVTITDRFGIPKANPLLAAERDARAQWLATLKQLCLDVEPLHPGPGRPPGR